ncbi:Carnitine O-acetyltransferase mitochondrial, variant 2 [Entomophthora muscae]|nr:Carnitine O-acetyltransferase mitochondrial, variant 2 [Entomophthora muscae]
MSRTSLKSPAASALAQKPASTLKPMLQHQASLPKLPVPKLDVTLNRYLNSVQPVVSPSQFKQTCEIAKNFGSNIGKELQARLEARAADPKIDNWLEDWWNDLAYFGYRDPVVVYVSYFYVYNNLPTQTKNTRRAAEIVQAALQFRDLVVEENLTPETTRQGPMCMASYEFMFNATRIPAKPSDYVRTVDPTVNDFIVVARKNRFFTLPMSHSDGQRLSTADIEAQLDAIVKAAGESPDKHGVGILTTQNRDIWCDARKHLMEISPENVKSLEKMEASAFLLCLDDAKPTNREEAARCCWHGNGFNRFYDKSLQFIVFDNGVAGFNGEHSRMDGTPTCRLNDYICDSIAKGKVAHGAEAPRSTLPEPEQLKFVLDPTTQTSVVLADNAFKALTQKHQLFVQAYMGYGKDLIKKFKVGPDAYVQMIIQLAFYLVHGRSAPTYESGTTRMFLNGRTEVCRTVSNQSVAFVKAMVDPNVSKKEKLELARAAITSHIAYMAEAVKGQGVDRHLLGLKLSLKQGEPMPEFFKDPSFTTSSHWNLSTSQLSSEHFDGYGWGEVVSDGYGIAYMVKNNSLYFNVVALSPSSNKKTDESDILPEASKMKASLGKAADLIRDVFLPTLPANL